MKQPLSTNARTFSFALTLLFNPFVMAKASELVLKSQVSLVIDGLNGGAFPNSVVASPSGKVAYATTSSQDGFLITNSVERLPLVISPRLKSGFTQDEKYFVTTTRQDSQKVSGQVLIHSLRDGKQTLLADGDYFEGTLSDAVTGIFSSNRKLFLKRIDTGKVVQVIEQELPQRNRDGYTFRSDVLVSPKGNRWANLMGQKLLKIYEAGAKAPLLARTFPDDKISPYMFFTENGDHLFLNITAGMDEEWFSYNLKTGSEGCSLEIPSGFSIAHLAAAGNEIVGNLKPTGVPYCNEAFAGQCRLVIWEPNSCKIKRNVKSYASNFFQTAWIDQEHLLLIGDYGSGDIVFVVNFLTGETKSSHSIDGAGGFESTLSKGSREIFAISLAHGYPQTTMRFYKVSFDSLLK